MFVLWLIWWILKFYNFFVKRYIFYQSKPFVSIKQFLVKLKNLLAYKSGGTIVGASPRFIAVLYLFKKLCDKFILIFHYLSHIVLL